MTENSDRPIFIFGCPRSGTTLVRVMLDGHPRIAVSRETEIAFPLLLDTRLQRDTPRLTLDTLVTDNTLQRWGLDIDQVRAFVNRAMPRSNADLLRAVFASYAESHGKPRWANKMPTYVYHLRALATLFPDAQFVHVIRDGREVAASLHERSWGPRTIVRGALEWRRAVRIARADARHLDRDRYIEIRLEDLLAQPEEHLRRLCGFLGEEYSSEMLAYPGRVEGSHLARVKDHRHLTSPPTTGLRDWRTGVSAREQAAVEVICHRLLRDLGYPPGKTSVVGVVFAAGVVLRASAGAVKHRLSERLRGENR